MALTRRYTPEIAPGEQCVIGLDYSYVIPPGVGIQSGSLQIFFNTVSPSESTDFQIGPVSSLGRTIYATVKGGVEGTDYQLRWSVTDTDGNIWPRTALVLCAQTS